MATITDKGYFFELTNRYSGKVIFAAATDEVTEEAFDHLWAAVGRNVGNMIAKSERNSQNCFEIRITPIV